MTAGAVWDDMAEPLGDRLAVLLRDMVRAFEDARPRTQQRTIGPSAIGSPCTRCLARHALGRPMVREYDDPWCAIIGTAVHAWLDEAAEHQNKLLNRADWLPEMRVHPDPDTMPKGGNADLYHVPTATVIDHKIVSADRLRAFRNNGPGITYRRQGHLYGMGFAATGRPVANVAVAFWCRGGRLRDLYVWTEPYMPAVAQEAIDRYRTIRNLALTAGLAILPALPADPDCWDCGGADVRPEELVA